ncbi:methyltransferase [Streptomyces sp. TS71-3]|nr:methyltransferase [Streptomyces sp. TS71-3]
MPQEPGRPSAERYWEERYSSEVRLGRGRPNVVLAAAVTGLPPGSALDLGCGPGGDAVWLARQGWRVTAVDVSPSALATVRADADGAGAGHLVRTEQHDLGVSFPAGTFDLVSAQYLHSPLGFPRQRVLRQAAGAVAPGGLLLIVEHASVPPWGRGAHPGLTLPTAAETLAGLALDGAEWTVETAETRQREATGPAGESGTVEDNVIAARRHG